MAEEKTRVLLEQYNRELKAIHEYVKDVPIIKETMGKMEKRMERMEDNIEVIKISLRRKVDLEEFQLLEKRVIFLEKKLKV